MSNANVFNNLKIHTQYSICEGAIKIDDLAIYCKENKIKNIGICDSYNLCGALEFAEKVSKVGTQPIIGTQINFSLGGSIGKLPLFASTQQGYKNLIKLSSKSYLDSSDMTESHCNISELENINEGLVALSGNHFGLYGKLFKLNKLKLIEIYLKINFI
jgi:DNA polymerase-3 subunit alpha